VPFLADSKNIKKIPLSGGITNLNFKVEADGKSYVIRLAGEGTEQLGIKRDVEYAANYAAGQLGIAPEVVYFIEPEGYIVTRFVTGKRIMPEDIVKPDYLARVAKKLRLFHRNGPKLKGEFNVFRRVEMLTKVSKSNNAKFPHDWDFIMKKMREAEKALLKVRMNTCSIPSACIYSSRSSVVFRSFGARSGATILAGCGSKVRTEGVHPRSRPSSATRRKIRRCPACTPSS
jgi:thiamine kinase-like enzyme